MNQTTQTKYVRLALYPLKGGQTVEATQVDDSTVIYRVYTGTVESRVFEVRATLEEFVDMMTRGLNPKAKLL
jgi:hypothetical protein